MPIAGGARMRRPVRQQGCRAACQPPVGRICPRKLGVLPSWSTSCAELGSSAPGSSSHALGSGTLRSGQSASACHSSRSSRSSWTVKSIAAGVACASPEQNHNPILPCGLSRLAAITLRSRLNGPSHRRRASPVSLAAVRAASAGLRASSQSWRAPPEIACGGKRWNLLGLRPFCGKKDLLPSPLTCGLLIWPSIRQTRG